MVSRYQQTTDSSIRLTRGLLYGTRLKRPDAYGKMDRETYFQQMGRTISAYWLLCSSCQKVPSLAAFLVKPVIGHLQNCSATEVLRILQTSTKITSVSKIRWEGTSEEKLHLLV